MRGLSRHVPIFFDAERRVKCAISRERDLAATVTDLASRTAHVMRARSLAAQLPQSDAERLLLALG